MLAWSSAIGERANLATIRYYCLVFSFVTEMQNVFGRKNVAGSEKNKPWYKVKKTGSPMIARTKGRKDEEG